MKKTFVIKNHHFPAWENVIGELELLEDGCIVLFDGLSFYIGNNNNISEDNVVNLQKAEEEPVPLKLMSSSLGYRPAEYCDIYLDKNISLKDIMDDKYCTEIIVNYKKNK